MIALGIVQIIRIFVYPMSAHGAVTVVDGNNVQVMTNAQFISSIVYLVVSAACMVFGGLMSMKNSKTLQNHLASLEK